MHRKESHRLRKSTTEGATAVCGILGFFGEQISDFQRSQWERSSNLIRHRGPDDSGEYFVESGSSCVRFSHKRLAIIDLSPGGRQPMQSTDSRTVIAFNGEIYNYREVAQLLRSDGVTFRSDSDTEVLLEAWRKWGEKCLSQLTGMFAFAVYDTDLNTVTLVRDPFGIKPLYWTRSGQGVAFSSEIPPLLGLRGQKTAPNLSFVYNYLLFGDYDTGEETFFEGIHRVQPGHLLTFDVNQPLKPPVVRRWWEPNTAESPRSFSDAVEATRAAMIDSVRLHLRSDVPLGIALSGGIDSSTIACLTRYLEPDIDINTFSFLAHGSPDNEESWVQMVNNHIGAIPHQVLVSPEDIAADIDSVIYSQAEPFGGTSIYAQYRVFQLAKESGVTVTLDGQGADELFAGYHGYVDRRLISLLSAGRFVDAAKLLRRWSQWPGRRPVAAIGRIAETYLPKEMMVRVRSALGSSPSALRADWLTGDVGNVTGINRPGMRTGRRSLVSALAEELTDGGLEALLRHGDRNSMKFSVESRVPFLTTDLADLVLSFPEEYLLSKHGETKHVLREAMRGIVPDAVLDRRDKVGFQTPEKTWVSALPTDELVGWLEGLKVFDQVDHQAVLAGIQGELEKGDSLSTSAWRYLNAGRWAQLFL